VLWGGAGFVARGRDRASAGGGDQVWCVQHSINYFIRNDPWAMRTVERRESGIRTDRRDAVGAMERTAETMANLPDHKTRC
jgi:hypothetical protein